MSAYWDCQKHNTTNLGSCPVCAVERMVHGECQARLSALEAEVKKYKEALCYSAPEQLNVNLWIEQCGKLEAENERLSMQVEKFVLDNVKAINEVNAEHTKRIVAENKRLTTALEKIARMKCDSEDDCLCVFIEIAKSALAGSAGEEGK